MSVFDTFLNWAVFRDSLPLLLTGLWVTAGLGLTAIALGLAGGLPLVLARLYGGAPVRFLAISYIDVFRAIPVLVLLIVIYYALPFVGIRLSPFASATAALSLVSAAYSAEILRAGIEAVPVGQVEASRAVGMGPVRRMTRIVLPQALRLVIPPLTSNAINVFKDTALASVVAMPDLLKEATQAQALAANPTPLIGAAAIYIVLLLPCVRFVGLYERASGAPDDAALRRRLTSHEPTPMPLDIDHVRRQFPALADGFAYFDNAGGSLVLGRVADRVRDYLLTTSVQTGASYPQSRRAVERVAEARGRIALLLNARRPEEIVLGPSTTVLFQFLARAMESRLEPGDEVVVTDFDHESNIGPWRALEKRGVVIRTWGLDPTSFEVNLDDLDALMTERTRLVAVTHCSNILGTVNPVAEIARRVHARGAEIAVDAVAYAPHRAVDVQAFDVDYYVFSFYKTFGPHFAVLYGKYDKLLELDGLYHYFYGREKVPMKLEPGNTNYELAWGSAGIFDYLDELGGGSGDRVALERAFGDIAAHETALGSRLLDFLGSRNDVRVIGRRQAGPERVPTISFEVEGRDSAAVVGAVDRHDLGIRFGDFHSRRLVERLGLAGDGGVVRVSMVHYNTLDEVDRLVAALDEALR